VAFARTIPFRGVQRAIAQRLVESAQTTASVTAMAEVDASVLFGALARLKANLPGVSLTHLLIRATARCLRRHPQLNATLVGDTLYELAEINLSVALSLPSDELLVATIRQADEKPLEMIVDDLHGLRERARKGKLTPNEMRGGTFTLSNYGMLRSVVWATPILVPGQVGVLGIGRAISRLVPDRSESGWTMRPILPFSLTYDHRVVNGVPAGRFLDDLADLLTTDVWIRDAGGA
jgi:pyruvate dehydrogenase E2 component (dihydrolipoamide acetyltransferase)